MRSHFGRGLEARQDGEHGRHSSVCGATRPEIRVADDLLVIFTSLERPEIVRHLHDHDAVEDRLVGVVGLELLPLGLVRVRDDARVDVDHAVPSGRRSPSPAWR